MTIDNKKVETKKGATVLEAAQKSGIYVPALCGHPGDSPFACRLCIVAIEGMADVATACTTPVADGMIVLTNTPRINRLRKKYLRNKNQ